MIGNILERLSQLGITVTESDGKIAATGPDDAFTPEVDALIRNHRVRILNEIITPLIHIQNKVSSNCNSSVGTGFNCPPPFEKLVQLGINTGQQADSSAGTVRNFTQKKLLDPLLVCWIEKAEKCQ